MVSRARPPVMEWGIMHAKRPPSARACAGCSVIVHREIWVCFALRAIFSATLIRLVLMGALSLTRWAGRRRRRRRSPLVGRTTITSLSLSLPLQFSFSGLIIRAGTGYIIVHDITIPGLGRVGINLWIRIVLTNPTSWPKKLKTESIPEEHRALS